MKKTVRKLLSLTCALALAASLLPAALAAGPTVGGWFESIYAELPGVSKNQIAAVSWTGAMDGELAGEDLEYLVRNGKSGVRIDIPGLKAGEYTLKITVGDTDTTVSGIQVLEYDRSGYAHYNYTDGVGAYNDDGTLKEKAKVIYVTDENKDTVKLTGGGATYTGLGNILGRKTGVLNKLAKAGTPLVVRIVGDVKAPKGVSEKKMSTDAEKQNGDNGGMISMAGAKDLTIEGVGNDAVINGWGVSFSCQTSDYNQGVGKSFEVRNITFRNVPEDCVNIEGVQEGDKLTAPVERTWVHNCSFYGPKIANPAAVDKAEGDGAVDFKRGQYMTLSYNYFESYHKTHLIGGADNNMQYNVTWHHNHYYKCESRGPLGRQANMHIYNSIYENQSSYCMNTRANCYIFSEYNSFISSKNPMRIEKKDGGNGAGGPIKSFNDKFTGCSGDRQGTVVKDKTQTVASKNRYANFDIDPKLSYIPSGDYKLDESNAKAEEMVRAYAGPMKAASAIVHPAGTVTAPKVDTAPSTATPAPSASPATPAVEVTMPADVTESDWFYPAVKTVLAKGAMKGTNLGFEPNRELTIASIYQTLYNMEGSPAVTAGGSETYSFDPADISLGTSDDRAVIPEGTAYAGGYLKTTGKVVQRWHEGRGAAFCAELDKDQKGAIEFTVASTAEAVISASSTGKGNTSAVGLLNVATGATVPNAEGISTVTDTAPTDLTYQLGAGTYRVVSTVTDDPNMNRGVRIHGVTVTAAAAPVSDAWYAPAVAWAFQQGLYTGTAATFADSTALRGDVKTIMDAYCAKKGVTAVLFKGDQSGNLMLDKTLTRAEWAQVLANLDQVL